MKDPKNIVITGASSGIGEALALLYAAPGVQLFLHGRNVHRLEQVAQRCKAKGAAVETASIEITEAERMTQWLREVDARAPIDLLIANAGISGGSGGTAVHGEEPAQVRRIMAVNVDGIIATVTALMGPMVARKRGQIAVMSSLAGFRGMPSAPAYSTSKAAARFYGEALRGWLAPSGVEVSVICPGFIRTPLTSRNPFPMPFIMSAERAANIIARGLLRNKPRIAFPWQLYYPMLLISQFLPLVLTDWFFSKLPSKPAV